MQVVSFKVWPLRVRSASGGERIYTVTMQGNRPLACTCPSYEHRDGPLGTLGGCKHMRALVGPDAVGKTRCQRCRAFLTPADLDYDAEMAAAEGLPDVSDRVTCMECWG